MSVAATVAKFMLAAGASPEEVVQAVAEVEADAIRLIAEYHAMVSPSRSRAAERQARYRERNKASRVTESDACDACDGANSASSEPPKVPPTPPLNTPKGSEPIGSAASAAIDPPDDAIEVIDEDPRARLFRKGKTLLVSFGVPERRTGPLIGQWLKVRNDPAGVLAAIQFARDQSVADPIAYVSATIHSTGKPNGRAAKSNLSQVAFDLAAEARELELAAGIGRPASAFRSD